METTGSRIKYVRQSAGLTQAQLASVLHEETEITRGAIGSNPALTTDKSGCVAASRVLSEITPHVEIITRRFEWPNDFAVDDSFSSDGLLKAVAVARAWQQS